jgi:amicoumacin kinase
MVFFEQKVGLKMLLEKFASLYEIPSNNLVPITDGFHNSVYSYQSCGSEYILRVSNGNRRSIIEIRSEMEFIKSLANAGVSVSTPFLSKNGNIIEEISINGQKFHGTSFIKAEGVPVVVTDNDIWNAKLFYEWGNIIGKIHKISSLSQDRLDRPIWTENKPDLLNLLPKIKSDSITNRYQKLLTKLNSFRKEPELFGIMHNDLHQGNFFVNNGSITLFDFDECAYHWFAYDLAVSFYHAYWQSSSFTPENTDFSQTFWEHFLNGYQKEHRVKKEIFQQIPIFLKIREIFLYVLFSEKWDMKRLEEWQVYNLRNLEYRIQNDIPYGDFDFTTLG